MPESRLVVLRRERRLVIGLCAVAVVLLAYAGVSLVVAETLTKPYRRPLASSPAIFDWPTRT